MNEVNAEEEETEVTYGIVNDYDVRVRTGPSTSYAQMTIDGEYQYYEYGETLVILGSDTDSSGYTWYNVNFTRDDTVYTGWIRGDFVQLVVEYEYDEEFEAYLDEQGFPEDYKDALRQLHALHPTWTFVAYDTGLDWDEVISKESRLGYNLIDGSNLCNRSVEEGAYDVDTGTFIAYDGTTWFCANSETIAYYIDPRNFLNEKNIFMFLELSFSDSQTADVVQNLLDGTFMSGTESSTGETYAQVFYEAGEAADVSPIYLAVLALQEQGTTGTRCTTGESFTYNGTTYSSLYNFYNIGATSGTDNWKKGLIYANGGESGTSTTYNRPWNTAYKAIVGGALWIADGYINVGQSTMYFQKFNVTSKNTYTHQYMTNVRAAYSQSSSMYSTFEDAGCLESNLVFTIPIFNNMPESTSLPTTYTLPTVDDDSSSDEEEETTGDFITDLNLTSSDGYLTGFTVGTDVKTLTSLITSCGDDYSEVVVTDSNGEVIDSDDLIANGYTLSVSDSSGTSTYTIVLKGDLNGNGKVDLYDLVLIRKDILGMSSLSGNALRAALIDGDTSVSLAGYVAIRKDILGIASVSQD